MTNFTPWSAIAGGLLIGLAALWLLSANRKIAGVSGIVLGMLARVPGDFAWRAAFIGGLVAAGFAWHAFMGAAPQRPGFGLGWAAASGLLVGFGTRMGGGCTSGHGVCGIGRLSLRSVVATALFMAAGVASAFVTRHLLGVAS